MQKQQPNGMKVPEPKTYASWVDGQEWYRGTRRFSDARLHSLLLTERTWNCVYNEIGEDGTIDDIKARTRAEWGRVPNMGKKSVDNLMLAVKNLALPSDVTDIPEDVMKAARDALEAITDAVIDQFNEVRPEVEPVVILARAILAERERCALVAEESRARSLNEIGSKLLDHRFAASKAGEIATSIRNPMGYLNQIDDLITGNAALPCGASTDDMAGASASV